MTTFTREDGLLDNRIGCLLEDRQRKLWIGTPSGLSFLEGNRITHFSTPKELSASSACSMLEDSQGVLWIASNSWLFRLDGDSLRPVQKLRAGWVYALVEGCNGELWVGTAVGLLRYAGGELRRISVKDSPAGKFVEALLVDSTGRLLIGTRAGLHVRDLSRPLPGSVEAGEKRQT